MSADSKPPLDRSDKVTVEVRRPRRSGALPRPLVRTGLLVGDIVLLIVAALLAAWIRFDHPLAIERPVIVAMLALPTMLLIAEFAGLYQPDMARWRARTLLRWAAAWSFALGLVLTALFFSKTGDLFSRLWVGLWYVLALATVLPARFVVSGWIRDWYESGRMGDYMGVVGHGPVLERLVATLLRRNPPDVIMDDLRTDPAAPIPPEALEQLGAINRLVLAFDPRDEDRIQSWLGACRNLNVDVDLAPPFTQELQAYEPHEVGGLMMWRLATRPMSGESLALKRAEDIVLGSLMLLVALPLMAAVALAVRLDTPGPVLFRQRRHGFNGREFTVLKFRSMTAAPQDDGDVPQARRDDPRVTRVGAIIRRTSLDELPQILNVLRGEMSLVGPRPHAVAHNEAFGRAIDDYLTRHRVKPGITGWAQVNGFRGETETIDKMKKRVEYDLYYIDNWSLGLDLRILLRTVAVIVHPNAY